MRGGFSFCLPSIALAQFAEDLCRNFATAEEAAQYWKDVALKYKQQYEEIEELTSVNDELMKSLEGQVNTLEDQNADLQDKLKLLNKQLAAAKEDAGHQRETRREELAKQQDEIQELLVRILLR